MTRLPNSLQAEKERAFHVQLLVEGLGILVKKTFYDSASA